MILCSIHQLPQERKRLKDLLNYMSGVEFHFALENISGSGKKFLKSCVMEAKIFKNAEIIDSSKTSWSQLYKLKIKYEKTP